MVLSLRRLLFSRLLIWLILAGLGGYFVYNLGSYIKRGIDLAGGLYITLEVQLDKAREAELSERIEEAEEALRANQKVLPLTKRLEGQVAILTFDQIKNAAAAAEFLSRAMAKGVSVESEGTNVRIRLTTQAERQVDHDAVESNIAAINSRINQFAVSETHVARQGEKRIIVELPDVHNPQQARAIIGKAALLEIKPIEDAAPTERELLDRYGGKVPEGTMILKGEGAPGQVEYHLVPQFTDVTGRQLKTAYVSVGGRTGAEPVVAFRFKPKGAQHFGEMTEKNIGRRLALIIDGVEESAPVVQSRIDSVGTISGAFTSEQARELAGLMRAGAFVAPVTFEEERHIGPSLGSELVRKGLIACIIGMLALLIFCIFVYKAAGMLAYVALLFNLLLSLGILAMMQAALTLPGIAGLILSIGMAIDASILIFERVREELAHGVPLRKAIDTGFAGALAVILDSNITSLLVAMVLYWLGTGPIKGFAATQIVGIVATLITGLWMLRSFFTYATDVVGVTKMKF